MKFLKSFILSAFVLSVSANAGLLINGSFESLCSASVCNAGNHINNFAYSAPYNLGGDDEILYTNEYDRVEHLSALSNSGNWGIFGSMYGWSTVNEAGIEVQYNGTVVSASEGDNYLELDTNTQLNGGDSNGGIFQNVSGLTVGLTYLLSFDYRGRLANPDKILSNAMQVSWTGVSDTDNDVFDVKEVGTSSPTWTTYTFSIVASDTTMEIRFEGMGENDSKGALLDNVALSTVSVPEPSVIALMLFALCGIAVRRKS